MSGPEPTRRAWFERRFALGLPPDAFPDVLERLRGTPLRVSERTSGIPEVALKERRDGHWSIQENVGHLADLEPLWLGRLDDLENGTGALRPADLQNRATWEANHNARALSDIISDFGRLRAQLVARTEAMSGDELIRTAAHPRLGQPMSVVDLCFFVAEHDDHHLATISRLRREQGV